MAQLCRALLALLLVISATAAATTTTTPAPLNFTQFDPNTPEGNPKRQLLPQWPNCGPMLPSEIVGGKDVKLGEFPWLALLGCKNEGYYDYSEEETAAAAEDAEPIIFFVCAGTLISDRYVVTAAHCIPPEGLAIVQIRLGEHNWSMEEDCQVSPVDNETLLCNEPPVDIDIERIITHPEYNKPFKYMNDIALIRLSQPVTFTRWISPICLPFGAWRTGQLPKPEAIVAGFGVSAPLHTLGNRSTSLQKADLSLVDHADCRRVYSKSNLSIGPSHICAGNIGQDLCEGDAGSPLMMHDEIESASVLVGVASLAPTNCRDNPPPGSYTKVAHYIDWILEQISP